MRATAPRLGARILRPVMMPPRPLPAPRPPAPEQITKKGTTILSHCGGSFITTRTTKRSFAMSAVLHKVPASACALKRKTSQYKVISNFMAMKTGQDMMDFKWPSALTFSTPTQPPSINVTTLAPYHLGAHRSSCEQFN